MSVSRYSKEEVVKLENATNEFMLSNGTINWKGLFEKHKFPGREQSNIKVKYNALKRSKQKKRERQAEVSAAAAAANGAPHNNGASTAFERFAQKTTARLRTDEPNLDQKAREKKINDLWGKLTDTQKAKFGSQTSRKRKGGIRDYFSTSGSGSVRAKKQRRKEELKMYETAATTGTTLPQGKVKRVMRSATPTSTTKEAVALIAKATEMFVLWLAEKSAKVSGHRKLSVDDMIMASKCQEEARFIRVALFNDYTPEGM